ncbi:MAG: preprotein translocase subunit YajC [Pirellulales bacterium]
MISGISSTLIDSLNLLAQSSQGSEGTGQSPSFTQIFKDPTFMFLLMAGVLFFLLVVRPQRGEMKRLQQMLAALKKNDRVVTRGGIHGIVVSANANEPTVVIRIDESSGARMTINRDAVVSVNPDSEPSKKS